MLAGVLRVSTEIVGLARRPRAPAVEARWRPAVVVVPQAFTTAHNAVLILLPEGRREARGLDRLGNISTLPGLRLRCCSITYLRQSTLEPGLHSVVVSKTQLTQARLFKVFAILPSSASSLPCRGGQIEENVGAADFRQQLYIYEYMLASTYSPPPDCRFVFQ